MLNIYLAGPIDLNKDSWHIWKSILKTALDDSHLPCTMYNASLPYALCANGKHHVHRARWIETINNAAVDSCDLLIAHVPSNIMSIGTPIEINRAHAQCKEIIIITDIPYGTSAYLTSRVMPDKYFTAILGNVESVQTAMADVVVAINKLIEQPNGEPNE